MESKIQEIEILQLRLNQHETLLKLVDSNNQKQNEHVFMKDETQQLFSENEAKLENLEQKVKELGENFNILLGSVDDLERTTKFLEHHLGKLSAQSQNFKCNLCGQMF